MKNKKRFATLAATTLALVALSGCSVIKTKNLTTLDLTFVAKSKYVVTEQPNGDKLFSYGNEYIAFGAVHEDTTVTKVNFWKADSFAINFKEKALEDAKPEYYYNIKVNGKNLALWFPEAGEIIKLEAGAVAVEADTFAFAKLPRTIYIRPVIKITYAGLVDNYTPPAVPASSAA